jgi:putative salt-induced outer membrane protein
MTFARTPLVFISLLAAPAFAQETQPVSHWSGEGAFGAGFTSGNTETKDASVALKAKHAGMNWTQAGEFRADYGDTDGVESKNRLSAAAQFDRQLSPKWSGYTRGTWEKDEFSGFENRYFLGVGAAYKAIETPATKWTVEGGPGYRVDEIRATLTTPADRDDAIGARAGSRFSHAFNDRVSLSNDTELVYANDSTQISNGIALSANLMGNLSARVSLDVRHDSNPPEGFEATDTSTKFSLVYKVE